MPLEERQDSSAPREVNVRGNRNYERFERLTDLREPYRISGVVLDGTKPELKPPLIPPQPTIAFINARSGGNMGPAVAAELQKALGDTQVFDLSQYRPDKVLSTMWSNLTRLSNEGDAEAKVVLSRLRIIAAGGDGTVAWILKTIRDLQLNPAPAVAIMPLGTGNDLSRQLNWGPAFKSSWIRGYRGVRKTLAKVAAASDQQLDNWDVKVRIPYKDMYGSKPHSLLEEPWGEQGIMLSGVFYNYISVGLDAKSALGFHTVRENAPALAANRFANMFWYAACSFKAGWFGCSRPLRSKCQLKIQKTPGGPWEDVALDASVRAVVLLNLQNYGGGVNLWGNGLSDEERQAKGFHEPWYCDGMIEVVAFVDGYHTGVVMGTKGNLVHAKRLAQACGVRITLRSSLPHNPSEYSHAYLQVDGEPWTQAIPAHEKDAPVEVEVSYVGTCKMLYNGELSDEHAKKNEAGVRLQQRYSKDARAEPTLETNRSIGVTAEATRGEDGGEEGGESAGATNEVN